ncbi:MAG TPA: XrtA-associated tyrosine autokinase [Thiohalobacter sp.]|nr:XrtA-associated tyrosine autokinase [Thiohalobacter sp.]
MSIIEKAMEKLGGAEKLDTPELIEDTAAATQASPRQSHRSPPGEQYEQPGAEVARDREVRDPDARIQIDALYAHGILDPGADPKDNSMAEEFRRIKRPVLAHVMEETASRVEHPNLVMVTSSVAGEGKTFTAINLAMSIAMEMDKTVLLVDADIAKPEVTSRLGVAARQGLTDVLLGECRVQDALLRTNVPSLSLLPAGKRHTHSTELLGSSNMRRLADELSLRYPDRVIIFDSPPLMLTSEARVLAGLMGQILVVVEESKTPQRIVTEALGMLNDSEIVGLVLNKSHRTFGGDYYGYGYGYGL